MYFEQPYGVRPPPLTRVRRQYTSFRYILLFIIGICVLLIIGVFIALFIIYFIRYRNRISSILSYPDFICSQRPCGCPNIKREKSFFSKIIGGKDASPFIYPWLVALANRYRTDPFCSGFIISSNTILTAAHCLSGRNFNEIEILSKIHDIRRFNGNRHDIDKWFIHPEYRHNQTTYLNDIGIIKIKQKFPSDVQPCCLPTLQSSIYPKDKTISIASGWGKISSDPNGRNSPILQHVSIPIVDERNSKCRYSIVDINRQLCAGYNTLSIDTCAGDSGGPLVIVEYNNKTQGNFVATGIVSYGNRQCDSSISSGVYTRVGFYIPWIESILSKL